MDTSIFDNKVEYGVDWLNAVLMDKTDVKSFFDLLEVKVDRSLCFESFQELNHGTYNYNTSYGLNGERIFIVAFNRSKPLTACDKFENEHNPFIFISVSGDGLRYINSLNDKALSNFFLLLKQFNARCSRIDVNMDLFVENPIVPLLQESVRRATFPRENSPTLRTNLRRSGKNFSLIVNFDDLTQEEYMNVSIGSHSSQWGMFRCYNKSAELRNAHGLSKDDVKIIFDTKGLELTDYWWRLEYELHKEKADLIFQAVLQTLDSGDNTFQVVFLSALDKMFTPVMATDNLRMCCIHPERMEVVSVWAEFMEYIGNSIHFVELANIPYIPRNNLPKFQANLKRLSGYLYIIFKYMDHDPEFISEVLRDGGVKYQKFKDNRYAFMRDVFDNPTTVDGKYQVEPLFEDIFNRVRCGNGFDEVF